MKVVIVGGVAGGATAAARLRRLDERAEIALMQYADLIRIHDGAEPVGNNDDGLAIRQILQRAHRAPVQNHRT